MITRSLMTLAAVLTLLHIFVLVTALAGAAPTTAALETFLWALTAWFAALTGQTWQELSGSIKR